MATVWVVCREEVRDVVNFVLRSPGCNAQP